MKKIDFPVGISDFSKIRENEYYYIDKTGLICEVLKNPGTEVTLITRPRRFGKTLGMSMLAEFFDIEKDSRKIFQGLEISNHEKLCHAWQNQRPTVFLTFKNVDGLSFDSAYGQLKYEIGRLYEEYAYLLDGEHISDNERQIYERIRKQAAGEVEVTRSLQLLLQLMNKYYGKQAILLLDEYDVPLDKAFLNGYYNDMVGFIRTFLGRALKTNDNTEFAVVTGCLRISKESIFTGLNNFSTFTITDDLFSQYFGFTDNEVKEMLDYYGVSDYYSTAKDWYDGYSFGKTEIYCPWDVLNYCSRLRFESDKSPQAFWINSSGNDIIRKFIEMANSTTKSEIESLIAGDTVVKEIHPELTYSELYTSIENIWSTLFMTGYLTQKRSLGNDTYELAIPNLEIRKIFQKQIYEWFKDFSRKDSSTLNLLCQAFADGNAEEAQKQFTAFLRKTISIRDTYVKAAKKENFYHGILLGLLSYRDDWIVKSNVESGDGYSDIVIKIPDDEIGMIIKVKYGEDADMDKGCADVLAQIERMNYSAILEDDEVQTIYKFGVACYKKRCKIVKA